MVAAQRATKGESSQRVRQGMRNGEEKYLLARDKGPVRRFIRDFVDSRFSFIELIIPLLVVTMVLGYSGNSTLASLGNAVLFGTILLVIVDMLMLRFRLRRQLARAVPRRADQGHDLLRGHSCDADEVHAPAQAAGEDRSGAPRALPMSRR